MMYGGGGGWWHINWNTPKDRPAVTRALLKRILSFLVPYWREGVVSVVCLGIGAAIGLAPHLMILALPEKNSQLLFLLVACIVGFPLLGGLISVLQSYFNNFLGERIMMDLRNH